ncbi:MAG: hypothetical protein Q6365_018485, partial [Candidatus Sigynarchaeota archaeon]
MSIDKDKKDMQLEFSIKRYDKDWQLIFQHSFSRSWSAFKDEFSRFVTFASLFDMYFEAWEREQMAGKSVDDDGLTEKTRARFAELKKNPRLAREFFQRAGLEIKYLTAKSLAADQEAAMWTNRARLSEIFENWEAAEDAYRKALEVKPDDHAALVGLGLFYLRRQTRNLLEARKMLDKANAFHPTSPLVAYNVACLNALEGHVDEALVYLKNAIEID